MSKITINDVEAAESAKGWSKAKAYLRLSGPGWMQSAITLGAGTLAGSLFLGIIGGYAVLWVQVLAVIAGAILLAAIAYVTLSIEHSPFAAIKNDLNPALAWLWLISSLVACAVWSLPQYALSYAVLSQNLLPGVVPAPSSLLSKLIVSALVFAATAWLTMRCTTEGKGQRVYETTLKVVIALVVVAFMAVVIRLAWSHSGLPWGDIAAGFVPDFSQFFAPVAHYNDTLIRIQDEAAREYWRQQIVDAQRLRIIGAASAAVGINMTFILPFALLQRKWGKAHRRFALFDLMVGMVVPFVLATSAIVLVAAALYHAQPFEGLLLDGNGTVINAASPGASGYQNLLSARLNASALAGVEVNAAEREIAAMLVNRDAAQLSRSLDHLTASPVVGNVVFGIGVLGMGLSTISVLILISSFAFQAALPNLSHPKARALGVAFCATGVLWPLLWQGDAQIFLAVSTSAMNYVMLPIAAITFWIMINSKRVLGEQRPKGKARWAWNIAIGLATLVIGAGALYSAAGIKLTVAGNSLPLGFVAMVVMAMLILVFHKWRSPTNMRQLNQVMQSKNQS